MNTKPVMLTRESAGRLDGMYREWTKQPIDNTGVHTNLFRAQPRGGEGAVLVKVTANLAGGGKYSGSILTHATPAAFNVATNLTADEIGTAGTAVYILNVREVGSAGHALTLNTVYLASFRFKTSEGVPVYAVDGMATADLDVVVAVGWDAANGTVFQTKRSIRVQITGTETSSNLGTYFDC